MVQKDNRWLFLSCCRPSSQQPKQEYLKEEEQENKKKKKEAITGRTLYHTSYLSDTPTTTFIVIIFY